MISTELVASGHVMDVFAGALDQVGLAEMKAAVLKTGGIAILTETFAHDIFKKVTNGNYDDDFERRQALF